jgi:NAD(P)H-hydrate epimerase
MQPVVSVAEMARFDQAALATATKELLVRRAGMAVGFAVINHLGGVAGKRIVVLAGPGSNGADGRVAATMLRARGAQVEVLGVAEVSESLARADLVIDAAFGTGLSRDFEPPSLPEGLPVVAVDLPSGLDGDTGALHGAAWTAELTVTMAALKTGLLIGKGPSLSGKVLVADVGIPISTWTKVLVDDADLAEIPVRAGQAHKWSAAVTVVAGSPGMEGAATLCSLGALRAGAGMVRLVTPGGGSSAWPADVVRRGVTVPELVEVARAESARSGAMVIGPGLGLDEETAAAIRELVATRSCPVLLDADALRAVQDLETLRRLVERSAQPVVVTPHDGELARLLGQALELDRIAQLERAAQISGAIVLSKGPTTVVASAPSFDEPLRFVNSGTPALATAGTGDVLGGVIAALCARGLPLARAAALGAHLHGRASARAEGTMIASDLPALVGAELSERVS